MSEQNEAETDIDNLSSTLDEGLKSCHHVVSEYRSLLAGVARAPSQKTPANDPDPERDPRV